MMIAKQSDETLQDQDFKSKNHLNSDVQIILHTRISQSLFNGSWKIGKMGLLQYAKITTTLWNASKQDDPYADWYLLKSYQALFDAREKLKSVENEISSQMTKLRGIAVNDSVCSAPITCPLKFSTPFGFMAAYLIADVDFIIRQLLTAEKMGILAAKKIISIKEVSHLVQEVFAMPRKWRHTGVSRKDIIENNQLAQQAKELLGEVPAAVLNKEISFSFLPKQKLKI
jgi:integrating conjugative element protein (TIGR03761 family)